MNNVNLLRKTLKPYLKWHGTKLSFLALFLIALFRVKTVNLVDLSIGFKDLFYLIYDCSVVNSCNPFDAAKPHAI